MDPGHRICQRAGRFSPISADNGYLRFCSAFIAGPEEGFSGYTFFTGEETNDIVDVPAGAPYRPDPALDPQRQGGYAVVLDTETAPSARLPDGRRRPREHGRGPWRLDPNRHALGRRYLQRTFPRSSICTWRTTNPISGRIRAVCGRSR